MKQEFSCGAVIYQYRENQREFLLIKHLHGEHIGFPKGHMEADEQPIETAYREILEETGMKTFIYPDVKVLSHYNPRAGVTKEVTFFIGKPMNDHIKPQEEEVSQAFWCPENNVLKMLTHEGSRSVFTELLIHIDIIDRDIEPSLFSHVETHILPVYDQFDESHHRDHIFEVVKVSFDLIKSYPVRKDMVYLVACFHDLGLQFGRSTHHITSGELLQNDPYIQKHYTSEDIAIMVEAIFDHRASHTHKPRTIYGLILAEADRLLDVKKVIDRTVMYELHRHPELPRKEQIKHAFDHIIDKYGQEGYLKRYLDYEPNRIGRASLLALSHNEALLLVTLYQAFDKLSQ